MPQDVEKWEYKRSTGAVVTIQWSGRGNPGNRRRQWGVTAKVSWGGQNIFGATWYFSEAVSWKQIEGRLDEILANSDKAVIIFPHGKNSPGSASMSVHLYHC